MPHPDETPDDITGRDASVIVLALFEAAYVLRTGTPALLAQPSDAAAMEQILRARYPDYAQQLTWRHLLDRARALGYEPEPGRMDEQDLIEYILGKDPGATFVGKGDGP
jgi:hypothetical protein